MSKLGDAIAVFKTIEDERWSDEERINAIFEVAEMPTLNSITKYELQKALKWVLDRTEWFFDDNINDKEVEE